MSDNNRWISYSLLAAGLAGFAWMAYLVETRAISAIDEKVLLLFRSSEDRSDALGPVWVEETAAEITALGGYPILVLIVCLLFGALLIARHTVLAVFLVAAVSSGSLLSTLAKLFFDRPRPDLVDHLDRTFTSSFPSAHAMVSAITWLTIATVALHWSRPGTMQVYIVSCAVLMTAVVGISRVYLGVHWPSDVLAGWFLGGSWAALCWLVLNRIREAHVHQLYNQR